MKHKILTNGKELRIVNCCSELLEMEKRHLVHSFIGRMKEKFVCFLSADYDNDGETIIKYCPFCGKKIVLEEVEV